MKIRKYLLLVISIILYHVNAHATIGVTVNIAVDDSIWCTQKAMATLFDCSTDNIGLHLKNIYACKELQKEATTEFFSVVQI